MIVRILKETRQSAEGFGVSLLDAALHFVQLLGAGFDAIALSLVLHGDRELGMCLAPDVIYDLVGVDEYGYHLVGFILVLTATTTFARASSAMSA